MGLKQMAAALIGTKTPWIGRHAIGVVLATALTLLATFAVAGQAAAEPRSKDARPTSVAAAGIPGPFKIQNAWTRTCLDTSGKVGTAAYYGDCYAGDAGQKWGWHNGGYLMHLASGLCLTLLDGWGFLFACGVDTQYWTHQNQAIVNRTYGGCLEGGYAPRSVVITECRTTILQAWSVTYW